MRISVIIPVKNGEATLAKCLQSIREQTDGSEIQIIVLDSESTDNSKQIVEQHGVNVINIPADSFNHGLTRNIGVAHASGELLFTVQDAWLSERDTLFRMASHFRDPEVMGVVGHQAVAKSYDTNPMKWFKRYSAVRTVERRFTKGEIRQMGDAEKRENFAWDNVIAMYRKKALEDLPFVKTDFAEDWMWSYQALQKGWKLIYDTSVVTYHYHHTGFGYSFRVAYAVNYHFLRFFDLLPPLSPWFKRNLQTVYFTCKNNELKMKAKVYWVLHNFLGSSGTYLSHMHFLIKYRIGGEEGVKRSYEYFCKKVPQGKVRRS